MSDKFAECNACHAKGFGASRLCLPCQNNRELIDRQVATIRRLEAEVEGLKQDRQALLDSTELTAKIVMGLGAENEYLKSHLQMHSPQMNGQHSWRFRAGWPITSARGATPDDAVVHAMQLVGQSKAAQAAKGTSNGSR